MLTILLISIQFHLAKTNCVQQPFYTILECHSLIPKRAAEKANLQQQQLLFQIRRPIGRIKKILHIKISMLPVVALRDVEVNPPIFNESKHMLKKLLEGKAWSSGDETA